MCRTKVNIRETFSETQKKIALSKTGRRCAHCGKPLDLYNMTVDHCIPLSKGGLNKETNLVALCKDCNDEKSNSLYKPSDYYKYITPCHLKALDEAFMEFTKKEGWFDIQTFFPQDHYDIPNYRPLMGYSKNISPKELDKFFREYGSKARKMGSFHFKRARYRNIDAIEKYIDEHVPEYFSHTDHLETTYDHLDYYLRNGSIFTLTQGDHSEEIIAVFIFSLECIYIKGDVTFGIKVDSITDLLEKKLTWIYAYIEYSLLKGFAKENNFSHIIVVNESQQSLPYYYAGAFAITGNDHDNQKLYYRCLTFDKKMRIIPAMEKDDPLIDEVKEGTHYYQKFFEISDVKKEEIEETVGRLEMRIDKTNNECNIQNLGILNKKVIKEN